MKEFKCSKCHSKDVFIEKSGNNTGLYWITWLNKDQLRLAERQISIKVAIDLDRIQQQLEDYGKYKGILKCDDEKCEHYIPVSMAKRIVRGKGLGGVLGYLEMEE